MLLHPLHLLHLLLILKQCRIQHKPEFVPTEVRQDLGQKLLPDDGLSVYQLYPQVKAMRP